jgi:N-acetylmuramic acid 6-phosphate etherase
VTSSGSHQGISTEEINTRTIGIDQLPTVEILRLINAEDALVTGAIAYELPVIALVVDKVVASFKQGGRLIYAGSGTSGRLVVLDAAECPPTFGTPPSLVQALLAGAPASMTNSVEDVEDDDAQGARAIEALAVDHRDVVLGIAASGRTPYVVGALRRARELGASMAALVANAPGPVSSAADLVIAPRTGPEVIAGSTRMKAGTAQKLVLNMVSTAAMIRTGRTYGNLMVDMLPRNSKLRGRARQIVVEATQCDPAVAAQTLDEAGGEVKTAILMLLCGVPVSEARERLVRANGALRQAAGSNHANPPAK